MLNLVFSAVLATSGYLWWRYWRGARVIRRIARSLSDAVTSDAPAAGGAASAMAGALERVQVETWQNPLALHLLVAEPGAGKSVAAERLRHQLLRSNLRRPSRLPLVLDLEQLLSSRDLDRPEVLVRTWFNRLVDAHLRPGVTRERLWTTIIAQHRLVVVVDGLDAAARGLSRRSGQPEHRVLSNLVGSLLRAGITVIATVDDAQRVEYHGAHQHRLPRASLRTLNALAGGDEPPSDPLRSLLSTDQLANPTMALIIGQLDEPDLARVEATPPPRRRAVAFHAWFDRLGDGTSAVSPTRAARATELISELSWHLLREGRSTFSDADVADIARPGEPIATLCSVALELGLIRASRQGQYRLALRALQPMMAARHPIAADELRSYIEEPHATVADLRALAEGAASSPAEAAVRSVLEERLEERAALDRPHLGPTHAITDRTNTLILAGALGYGVDASEDMAKLVTSATIARSARLDYGRALSSAGAGGLRELWVYAQLEEDTEARLPAGERLRQHPAAYTIVAPDLGRALDEAEAQASAGEAIHQRTLRTLGIAAWLLPTWSLSHPEPRGRRACQADLVRILELCRAAANPLRLEVSVARGLRNACADAAPGIDLAGVWPAFEHRYTDWHARLMVAQGLLVLRINLEVEEGGPPEVVAACRDAFDTIRATNAMPLIERWFHVVETAATTHREIEQLVWVSEADAVRDHHRLLPAVRAILAELVLLRRLVYRERPHPLDHADQTSTARLLLERESVPACLSRGATGRELFTGCPSHCAYADLELCPLPTETQTSESGADLTVDLLTAVAHESPRRSRGARPSRRFWETLAQHYRGAGPRRQQLPRGFLGIAASGLISRISLNALPLYLLLLLLPRSATLAGSVSGGLALAAFASGIAQGRLIDRHAEARVLTVAAVGSAIGGGLLYVALDGSTTFLVVSAAIAGATRPFVATAIRSWWRRVTDSHDAFRRGMSVEALVGQLGTLLAVPVSAVLVAFPAGAALSVLVISGTLSTLVVARTLAGAPRTPPTPAVQLPASLGLHFAAFGVAQAGLGALELLVPGRGGGTLAFSVTFTAIGGGLIAASMVLARHPGAMDRLSGPHSYVAAAGLALAVGTLTLAPGSVAGAVLGATLALVTVRAFVAAGDVDASRVGIAVALMGSMYFAGPAVGRPLQGFVLDRWPTIAVILPPLWFLAGAGFLARRNGRPTP